MTDSPLSHDERDRLRIILSAHRDKIRRNTHIVLVGWPISDEAAREWVAAQRAHDQSFTTAKRLLAAFDRLEADHRAQHQPRRWWHRITRRGNG